MKKISRRTFSKTLSFGLGTLAASPKLSTLVETKREKLGVALVGLGRYSEYELAPALQETKYCRLAGIVTGTPLKAKKWAKKYKLSENSIYNYDNFDTIINNEEIDIIYVVLPNAMHADFSIRAARAGKHVICEKPMAVSVEECDAIIAACKEANVKLGVGYRLHSEPYTQEIKRIVKGGGALMNMGVYAIQSIIYGSGQNPISVIAQEFSTRPEYFKDTDETITAQFEFPNGAVGNIFTSHNVHINRLFSSFDKGWVELNPANHYGPLSGRTSEGKTIHFPHKRHQTLQMDDFAKHILKGTPNVAPGEMGRRDMVIVEAIYQSINEGGVKIMLNF